MKADIKIIFLFLIMVGTLVAQNHSVSMSGSGTIGDQYSFERSMGAVFILDAGRGRMLIGTNVMSWNCTYSGTGANQFEVTNQPAFYPSYGTNGFPAIYFDTVNDTIHLRADFVASFIDNKKPWSQYLLVNCYTNRSGSDAIGFGFSGATNISANLLAFRPSIATITTAQFANTSETNSSGATISVTGVSNTNTWFYNAATFDGTESRLWLNLTASAATLPMPGNQRLNQFTIGGRRRQSGTFVNDFWGAIGFYMLCTNAPSGTDVTNTLNYLNTKYKVY